MTQSEMNKTYSAQVMLSALVKAVAGEPDPPGKLLAALLTREGQQLSVSDTARLAHVSNATAGRTLTKLAAAGLVVEESLPGERLVAINTKHALYTVLAHLLWVGYGARVTGGGHGKLPRTSNHTPYVDDGFERVIPGELRSRAARLPDEVYDGPEFVEARAVMAKMRTVQPLLAVEGWLQSTYSRWHDERDRDLVHLTLRIGNGAWAATRVLHHDACADLAADSRPRMGRGAWAHMIHGLSWEARHCLRLSDFLAEAVDRAVDYAVAADHVASDTTYYADVLALNPGDAGYNRLLSEGAVERNAGLAVAEAALEGYYRHGGTPPITAVNTAGERIIAAQLRQAASLLSELVHEMAAHPSFTSWCEDHPAAAQTNPLVPAIDAELPERPPRR